MVTEKNSAKKAKQHTVYKNAAGKRVCGTTTITGVLNKPALIGWANRLGLEGIEVGKYVDDLASIGTLGHYLIECHIKDETPYLDDYSKNQIASAETVLLKFLDWEKHHAVKYVESEIALVSEKYQYGGTIDILAYVDDVLTLIDIKTCKAIYKDHYLQVGGGYFPLLVEHDYKVQDAVILRVGRSEDEGLDAEIKKISNLPKWQEMFLNCRDIYNLK